MSELDFDVVVAGAGGAGCAAALAAAMGGRSVLLADARDNFRRGCNTAMSTSMIPAGGSRWQQALGIDDSPDLFHADVMRKTRGQADPTVARALLDPGDIVLVDAPTYFVFMGILASRGARAIGVETDSGGLRLDALEETLRTIEA